MAKKKKPRAFWCWVPGRLIACGACYLWFLVVGFFSELLPDGFPEWAFVVAVGIGWYIIWKCLGHLQEIEYARQNNIKTVVVPKDYDDLGKGMTVYDFSGELTRFFKEGAKEDVEQPSAGTGKDCREDEGASTKDMS